MLMTICGTVRWSFTTNRCEPAAVTLVPGDQLATHNSASFARRPGARPWRRSSASASTRSSGNWPVRTARPARTPRTPGDDSVLPVLPAVGGVLILVAVALRMRQAGSRLPGTARGQGPVAGGSQDDDRFWKAGLI